EICAAILRTATVHEHDTRILFLLEGGAAFGTAHPILFLLILRDQFGPFRLRLLAQFSDEFPVLLIEVFVLFAIALVFQVVFHRAFNLTLHKTPVNAEQLTLSNWPRAASKHFGKGPGNLSTRECAYAQ